MEPYKNFTGTSGLDRLMSRLGAGHKKSMLVLDSDNKTFDPADNSFVYYIVPGADGVKFSAMEENGERVHASREAYTYKAHQPVTGIFNRLALESGDACIFVGRAVDYGIIYPQLGVIEAPAMLIREEETIEAPVYVPESYKLFQGKDLGLLLKISREGFTDLADIEVGTIAVLNGEETPLALTAYAHANTELEATLADETATYYIAESNLSLDDGLLHAALIAEGSKELTVNLTLKAAGSYVVKLQLVEMVTETSTLAKIGRVLSESSKVVDIELSDLADILTLTVPSQEGDTVIDAATGVVAITMPYGTSGLALIPTFTTSDEITSIKVGEVDQVSGATENDFTEPVVYEIVAEDGETTKQWTVNISVAEPSTEAEILTYTVPGQEGDTVIDAEEGTVDITMPFGTASLDLIATFTTSDDVESVKIGEVAQVSGTTENDYTGPLVYDITAQDGVTVEQWTVTITIAEE